MAVPHVFKFGNDEKPSCVQVYVDGRLFPIQVASKIYKDVLNALTMADTQASLEKLRELLQPVNHVATVLTKVLAEYEGGRVKITENNELLFDDQLVNNSTTKRILTMHRLALPLRPMINFLVKLQQNPSRQSADELTDFLEHNNNPITEDGDFLAYKRVNANWKDCYTGTMDNSVGKVVEMRREDCDANRENTCSRGLHFASLSYMKGGWQSGTHLVVVKVNPADVVSIPNEYGKEKGRACKYLIHQEIKRDGAELRDFLANTKHPLLKRGEVQAVVPPAVAPVLDEVEEDGDTVTAKKTATSSRGMTAEQMKKADKLKKSGMNYTQIGNLVGVHRSTIQRYYDGQTHQN